MSTLPLVDFIATLNRTSGKSVTARTSITPHAWLAESPRSVRPIVSRIRLRAPSQPTTYRARAWTVSASPAGVARASVTSTGWSPSPTDRSTSSSP